ncbi:uncharacterized protein [Rutidosis leptorrhynchoides]|uniref:uncharacterized protein n=1 Tax=Rutidosis leptorrhynchoides TaxID=125765 RepID=UPI003A998104
MQYVKLQMWRVYAGSDWNSHVLHDYSILKRPKSVLWSWILNGRAFAQKITGAIITSDDGEPSRECPNCHYNINNNDVSYGWPGFPAGVKFEPSDADLILHLAAKCNIRDMQPHAFLNEFIPTLDGESGINYTHPENLPGSRRDGSSIHFFHRTSNAYASGQRKRRKIESQSSNSREELHFRWHKTGRTKPIMIDGVRMGWKRIMVLYTSSKKEKGPVKSNWVMHQLYLGTQEDAQHGDYVVSKILYQISKSSADKAEESSITEDHDKNNPKTPTTNTPNPPRPGNLLVQTNSGLEEELTSQRTEPVVQVEDDELGYLLGSQPPQSLDFLNFPNLMCKERVDPPFEDTLPCTDLACNPSEASGSNEAMSSCISELVNIETDTPPDFNLDTACLESDRSTISTKCLHKGIFFKGVGGCIPNFGLAEVVFSVKITFCGDK